MIIVVSSQKKSTLRALSELHTNWPDRFSQKGWLGLASQQVTLKGLVGFKTNFNGTTFLHHFCVKTGVKCPEEFVCYSLAPETYLQKVFKQIVWLQLLVHKIELDSCSRVHLLVTMKGVITRNDDSILNCKKNYHDFTFVILRNKFSSI